MISRADVDARVERIGAEAGAEALPAGQSPEARRLRRWVLHTLINEAVIATEAVRRGLADGLDDAFLPDGSLAEAAVVAVFETVTAPARVDDAAIGRYYAANADRYRRPETREVRVVLTGDEATGTAIAEEARAGADLDTAVSAVEPPRGPGTVGRPTTMTLVTMTLVGGQMTGAVEDAVFAAAAGAVIGPIRTELGWHVLHLVGIHPARTTGLAAVRDDILADLLAAERGRLFDEWLGTRRAELVTVRPGYEHPGDPRAPDPIHRH